jgi:hypothetical protein
VECEVLSGGHVVYCLPHTITLELCRCAYSRGLDRRLDLLYLLSYLFQHTVVLPVDRGPLPQQNVPNRL